MYFRQQGEGAVTIHFSHLWRPLVKAGWPPRLGFCFVPTLLSSLWDFAALVTGSHIGWRQPKEVCHSVTSSLMKNDCRTIAVDWIMASQNCPSPNPLNLWIYYHTWWKRLFRGVKDFWHGEIFRNYPGGPNVITKGSCMKEGKVVIQAQSERNQKMLTCWLWRQRKESQAKEYRQLLDVRKGRNIIFP